MAKGRRHQHAEANPLGHCRQPGERRVRLGQVGPRRTDLWDLPEVVHHPHLVDTCGLGVGGDRPEMFAEPLATARPVEARQVQTHPDPSRRSRGFALRRESVAGGAALQRCRNDDDGFGVCTASHGSARTASRIVGHRRSWLATTSAGTAIGRALLRRRHSAAWRVEHHGHARHPGSVGELPPPGPRAPESRPSVSITVVSRRRNRRATMSSSTRTHRPRRAGRVRSRRRRPEAHRSTRSDPGRSAAAPTSTCRTATGPTRTTERWRRELDGFADGARLFASDRSRPRPADGSGQDEFPLGFWAQQVVAQPEADTAHGVDEAQFRSTQLQLAAQVREVHIDDVGVADPVRSPHLLEQLRAGADLGRAAAQLLEQGELDAGDGDVVRADPDLLAADIDGQRTEA